MEQTQSTTKTISFLNKKELTKDEIKKHLLILVERTMEKRKIYGISQRRMTKMESNQWPTPTKPNKILGLDEVVRRFASGEVSASGINTRQPLYYGEQIIPDIMRMDLLDRKNFLESLDAEEERINKELEESYKVTSAAKKAERLRELRELTLELEKENTPPQPNPTINA